MNQDELKSIFDWASTYPRSAMGAARHGVAGASGLLDAWLRTLATADPSPERLQQMREAYARDVAVLPPTDVEALLVSAGFRSPVQFFQAGLMHGWYSTRP